MERKIYYYYSNSCGSCEGYGDVVDKLSTALGICCQKANVDEIEPQHKLRGVPTVIIAEGDDVIYSSVGNFPYEYLLEDVRKNVK